MNLINYSSLLKVILFVVIAMDAKATTQDEAIKCPPTNEFIEKISERTKTLENSIEKLEAFESGKVVETFNPNSYFTININDPEAVSKRVAENSNKMQKPRSSVTVKIIENCFMNNQEILELLKTETLLTEKIDNLRLSFLSLDIEKRQTLLLFQEQATQQQNELQTLNAQVRTAEEQSEIADEALRSAEANAQSESDPSLRELAAQKVILEKTRKEIADVSIELAEALKTETSEAALFSKQVIQHTSVLGQKTIATEKIENSYEAVTEIWRSLLDRLFEGRTKLANADNLPRLPDLPEELFAKLTSANEVQEYKSSYAAASSELKNLLNLRDQTLKVFEGSLFKLILSAGKTRAQILELLKTKDDAKPFELSDTHIYDLIREIRLVPYRPIAIFKTQILAAQQLIGEGLSGILSLLQNLIILFFFLATPFGSYWLMMRAASQVDKFRSWLVRNSRKKQHSRAEQIALWIHRLNPYVPWTLMLLATRLSGTVITNTELEGLKEILPYFEFYFLYKIFRIMVSQFAVFISDYSYARTNLEHVSQRVEKTGKFVGLFFLLSIYILEATAAAARKALFYHLVQTLLFWLSPLTLAIAAHWWKNEIAGAVERAIHGKIGLKLSAGCRSKYSYIYCLPSLCLIALILTVKKVYSETSKLDSAKRVSAQLFRRKLEAAAEDIDLNASDKNLPDDYLNFFNLGAPNSNDLFITPEASPLQELHEQIDLWVKSESDEHTIAIHGEKGVGKSSLLKQVENQSSNVRILKIIISDKIITAKCFWNLLGSSLLFNPEDALEGILKVDKDCKKTIILIDEAQNLFLAKRDGFIAFKLLASVINLRTENIFWCCSFNKYSWVYLNAVTGGSQFFRHVFTLDRWSDSDIQSLIMKRHEKSPYTLEFDPVLYAFDDSKESKDSKYLHDRFFEMLWEQSRGNPRIALSLWLSSLSKVGPKTLRVGIPIDPPEKPLKGLTEDELFVIAAIIRHENLTVEEAIEVTNLNESTVKHAMRIGLERGFLGRSDLGRYRIQALWQTSLTAQLVSKNFVYE